MGGTCAAAPIFGCLLLLVGYGVQLVQSQVGSYRSICGRGFTSSSVCMCGMLTLRLLPIQLPTQFIPVVSGGVVSARLVFRLQGFITAWNDPSTRIAVLRSELQAVPSAAAVATACPIGVVVAYHIHSRDACSVWLAGHVRFLMCCARPCCVDNIGTCNTDTCTRAQRRLTSLRCDPNRTVWHSTRCVGICHALVKVTACGSGAG